MGMQADHGVSTRLCVGLVGPLPPPSGGMANQCQQLIRLLEAEGICVELGRTNSPYRPYWIGRVPVLRAFFRLFPYIIQLWRLAGRVNVFHIFANSGWAWHLFVTPVVVIARLRSVPVIINYRGGNADSFFTSNSGYVLRMLAKVFMRVTPSRFLQRVFEKHSLSAVVIPNIIDLSLFKPSLPRSFGNAPHIIVTRNLEPIYDIPTAIRAFAIVIKTFEGAKLTVAGSGPELMNLQTMVNTLELSGSVVFVGRIENANIPSLYASADCFVNSSTVDNMPISILEAFASGVPVVTTAAGGIPDLVQNGVSGTLVPIGDDEAMAEAVLQILQDLQMATGYREAGLTEAEKYAWPRVRDKWLTAYSQAANSGETL
jgi:glycosyltransferase involved in cell wall biosynthesis